VLESSGLASEPCLLFGRRYRGRLEGRDVSVTFLPAQGLRPAQLDLTVGARLGLRAALAARRPVLDCGDCPRLDVDPAEWDGSPTWTREGEGVRRLTEAQLRRWLDGLLAVAQAAERD
jgi:hypothetical protein